MATRSSDPRTTLYLSKSYQFPQQNIWSDQGSKGLSRSQLNQVANDNLRQFSIPMYEIATVNKGMTAADNAIQLSTSQVKYTFTALLSRDTTFDVIYNIWRSVTEPFHSTMLPHLQVSVYCALTTFESGISQWIHPSEWLNANVKHIRAIFDGIVDLTGNKTITFPATMIFQVCYLAHFQVLEIGGFTCPSAVDCIYPRIQHALP